MSELLKKIRMRTWAEIDLDNLEYNFNMLKTVIGEDVKVTSGSTVEDGAIISEF